MKNCFIEFIINNSERFDMLQNMFKLLKEEKEIDLIDFRDSKWFDFFDEESLMSFWWPTEQDIKEYNKLWNESSFINRFFDPRLNKKWDFESMLYAFKNGEYELVSCERVDKHVGRIEYYPFSWPYGGSEVFKALIESYGFMITKEEV
ncbi:hypothetical protein [Pseudobacteroides cellulosolvens]|uniref:Uncharacterized protein n=1 Tax=Pseudobacteroides cellulosolvens ATCC 35603 = DSM 2933 TaxID=398512 RepID=A0A0L6JNK3_9FIRM|nr:hypothetical protein [Pseudobacteroides cellulosolvens]KNY26932.1 hypothetical protein Bccel_2197 [Pseudobacteroides cellulosolvens ATCC 35603 = DSM 2933]